MTVKDPDDDDEENTATVIISLMKKIENRMEYANYTIGYDISQVSHRDIFNCGQNLNRNFSCCIGVAPSHRSAVAKIKGLGLSLGLGLAIWLGFGLGLGPLRWRTGICICISH